MSATLPPAPSGLDAAAAVIASNRRRRAARRWIAIGSIPVLVVALVLVAKLLSMFAAAHTAITTHLAADPAGTIAAAQWQRPLNWFEPWKAPYNGGVGSAAAGLLPEAKAEFEEALGLATGLEVCAIRVNLSLVVEWMGDAAFADGDAAAAAALWQEALTITLDTPEECSSPEADAQSPDPERSLEDSQQQSQERLEEKLQEDQQDQSDQPDGEQPPGPSEGDLEALQDRLEQGAQDREDLLGDEGGGGGGTDRPW